MKPTFPWRSMKTSELLLVHASEAPRWCSIAIACEQMKEPYTDRFGKRWLQYAEGSSLRSIAEPSPEEEAEWGALQAEIDRRIPVPEESP